jgi:thioredoxin-related protein
MKKYFVAFIFTLLYSISFAQPAKDSMPNYKRLPAVPPFKLFVAPDSTVFAKDQLKKKKATVVMVFSPDCDHCVHSTEDLIAHYSLFKKVQIVMATSMPYEHVLKFYNQLKIADYPNIKVGCDASYFLGTFYEVRSFPAIFLYDKKGNFKQVFDANTKWETIAAAL